jgi:hypothetical protein
VLGLADPSRHANTPNAHCRFSGLPINRRPCRLRLQAADVLSKIVLESRRPVQHRWQQAVAAAGRVIGHARGRGDVNST